MYQLYREFYQSHGYGAAELVSSVYFKAVWNEEFPHVTIPHRSRFKQCDECVSPLIAVHLGVLPFSCCTPLLSLDALLSCPRCFRVDGLIKEAQTDRERDIAKRRKVAHRKLTDHERQEWADRCYLALSRPAE